MMPYRWTDKSRTTVLHRSRAESFTMFIRYLEYFELWNLSNSVILCVHLCICMYFLCYLLFVHIWVCIYVCKCACRCVWLSACVFVLVLVLWGLGILLCFLYVQIYVDVCMCLYVVLRDPPLLSLSLFIWMCLCLYACYVMLLCLYLLNVNIWSEGTWQNVTWVGIGMNCQFLLQQSTYNWRF